MTGRLTQMARLRQVTEAAFAAQQSNMTRLTRREAQLRQQIIELNAARQGSETPIEDDHAARAGADFLWQRWVDKRISALNAELARVLVEKSRAQQKLAKAFGRFQVTGHLLDQARSDRIIAMDKWAEREG